MLPLPSFRLTVPALLLIVFFWFMLGGANLPTPPVTTWDPSTKVRLQRAEDIYQDTIKARKSLIWKFGWGRPSRIYNFPPDQRPWPAYTIWDFFPPSFNCPHSVERLGSLGDGGKWICGMEKVENKRDCVVYSIGTTPNPTFPSSVLSRTKNCQLYLYDSEINHTPSEDLKYGPRTHFHPYGLAAKEDHVNAKGESMYTLSNLMRMNGHKHIDILTLSLDSEEFVTLPSLLSPYTDTDPAPLPFGQLLIEVRLYSDDLDSGSHKPKISSDRKRKSKPFEEVLKWFVTLEGAGLRPFGAEPNLVYKNYNKKRPQEVFEYSFINIKGDNAFTSEDV